MHTSFLYISLSLLALSIYSKSSLSYEVYECALTYCLPAFVCYFLLSIFFFYSLVFLVAHLLIRVIYFSYITFGLRALSVLASWYVAYRTLASPVYMILKGT